VPNKKPKKFTSQKDSNFLQSMITTKQKAVPSFTEFVVIVSLMMSLTAFSIDAILPALYQISSELVVTNPNDRQLVISVIYFGIAVGQLFFGPLSDHIGRKKAIYIGYLAYIMGALVSGLAQNFPIMLLGRILQGVGVSAPRGITLALVRDQYEGNRMARVMSFAMTVFILVPTIAPSIGQAILNIVGWRGIFGAFVFFALISVTWFSIRMPETLSFENRILFSLKRVYKSIREILKIRFALGFTLAAGCAYGVFVGYLNSSQQILQEQYALSDKFPLFFAIIALSLGFASFMNSRLVMRFGMIRMVQWALRIQIVLSIVFLGIIVGLPTQPPLWALMTYFMLFYFCTGILFGNINALAMQPLGHLAGIGSGVVGSFSTLLSMLFGTIIGRSYNGTILPLVIGMIVLTTASIFIVRWATAEK
jgi:DHA1 family bicyclomycin/chloramphenicol resistance-like MFS transporter